MSSDIAPRRLFVLLGDPVAHSVSPRIQNAAFGAAGIDAVYAALRAPVELVGPLMREVARAGGGGNVTVPHKGVAARALDASSEAVRATGACNVFWWEKRSGLCGDNTDVPGFGAAAQALLGGSLRDASVLLLGAGGAARAVVHCCLESGVARLDILNRTAKHADRLLERFGRPAALRRLKGAEAASSERYDLVVNATSVGLRASDALVVDPEALEAGSLLDLVYGPDETVLVKAARRAGIRAEDGRRMLVEQAALSFERWIEVEAPRAVMYQAVGLAGP